MSKARVYVTYPLGDDILALLREQCEVVMNPEERSLSPEELIENARGFDAVLTVSAGVNEEVARALASSCKIFANYGVGYNNIDVEAASKHGIYVSNTPDVLTDATADFAFALLLSAARRVVECDSYVRAGKKNWGPMNLIGAQVSGKTIGILGGGRIGKAVAKRAQGFNMRILYNDQRPNPDFEAETGGIFTDKNTLLSESDFVSVHVPLLPSTHHLIGAEELELMKTSAILINDSRGPIIDEQALVAALQGGVIAGAGLDVFESEPELAPGLAELPNVVLAPHVGSSTTEARVAMGELCARNIFAVLDGGAPVTCVNPEVGVKA
ncbi:2-hydroxyacid dehydrogenase [Paenibacillus sabinae]|uniref:D-isomer specific 2-hydroxyacid dehydrogenase n=1 Tax=Paenibacillus sabinae T27 TaxID=1268072 RepID=X4ZZ97_9BACL|nr:D-glycerate dehydrogenase [Paenibacillus sabinae]AHV96989.1 D-isomer specific 2-hydroxyacid dehydrogenase [Paenibacillus sabinae T27]